MKSVTGDNYSADLVVELFVKAKIAYQRSTESISDLYLQSVPTFSTGNIEAPDNPILRRELMLLERRTRIGGKDIVTHPSGTHDDLSNTMAEVIIAAYKTRATTTEIILGAPLISSGYEGSLVTDFDHL